METPLLPLNSALFPYLAAYRFIRIPASMGPVSWIDYPRIAVDMVFIFDGEIQLKIGENPPFRVQKAAFTGHSEEYYQILIPAGTDCLHLRFQPGKAHAFCAHPQYLSTNTSQALVDFMRPDAWALYQELGELETDLEKIHCLETRLQQWHCQSAEHPAVDAAIAQILRHQGNLPVEQLCQFLGTNYKSLNRWFKNKVGLSPKRFMQVTRFKHLLERLEIQQDIPVDWMQQVADFGFHDQAHFIRDFKQFAGQSPAAFMANRQLRTAPI
ncbi:MAG: helix-turn-helix domain-containing protein [Bacteroidota bacterium]